MEQNNSFFDSKTVLAVFLVIAVWFGWQKYMEKKYPQQKNIQQGVNKKEEQKNKSETVKNQSVDDLKNNVQREFSEELPEDFSSKERNQKKEEQKVHYQDNFWSFDISSKGMSLKNFLLKKYTDRKNEKIKIGSSLEGIYSAETRVDQEKSLFFFIKKIEKNIFEGIAKVDKTVIKKKMIIDSSNYIIKTEIQINDRDKNKFKKIFNYLGENTKPEVKTSFFVPTFNKQEFFVDYKMKQERLFFEQEDLSEKFEEINFVSIGTLYFTSIFMDKSNILPSVFVQKDQQIVLSEIQYFLPPEKENIELKFWYYFGPKDLERLEKIDPNLSEIIDFGWFGFLAKPLLMLMKFLYKNVQNYGFAIIILTILVRLLVLPFNVLSYKSMKKMQKIQPKIKEVREKHKEDSQKMNQEVLTLMKENKVNPFGGCLPIFLQLPVFIALYRVLGQSIELYKAPFIFWINDLSLKDPFFILPILMGITMFIQQKITPTTAIDPNQQKIMLFLPIVFTFFMIGLPSGLTLYIFISTLFGIFQQIFFMREKKTEAT